MRTLGVRLGRQAKQAIRSIGLRVINQPLELNLIWHPKFANQTFLFIITTL